MSSVAQTRRTNYPDCGPGATLAPPSKPQPEPAKPAKAPRKARKPKAPPKPKAPDTCCLTLRIRDTDYRVRVLEPGDASEAAVLVKLVKVDGDREAYHVAALIDGSTTCDCADCEFRQHECKHLRSLRAVGILPPAAAVDEDARWSTTGGAF